MKRCLFSASDAADDKGIRAKNNKRNAHDNTDNNTRNSSIAKLAFQHDASGFEIAHCMALPPT
jgi:hypothetical protein